MKIHCKVAIRPTDAPKAEFVEWVRSLFDHVENKSGIFFDVNSDSIFAAEFADRIRALFVKMPALSWHIEYSKSDIENAHLLHLWSSSYIAELVHPPNVKEIEITTTSLKAPRPFGALRPFPSVAAVNEILQARLALKNLKGLAWGECKVRNRKPQHQSVWRVSSVNTMPESPVPLMNTYGEPFNGDYEKGCLYRSQYREVELAYTAESIESMSNFDVALTKEKTGNYPGTFFQNVIVTQDFRRALEDEKVRGAKYTPVRILQPGESVIRDPFQALASGCTRLPADK